MPPYRTIPSNEEPKILSWSEKKRKVNIAFPVHKRYIIDSEKLNQQRLNCASQMREPLYILLIRDKEQQIEVKINLSPENYRQFLETMTEDQ